MMKKAAWLLVSWLIILLFLSSCGVAQEEYDVVVDERDDAQAQTAETEAPVEDRDDAQAQTAETEAPVEELEDWAKYVDVESGVEIVFVIESDMFPDSWLTESINANAEPLENSQVSRSLQIIRSAMRKYPSIVLRNNLEKIYIVRELRYYGITAGGTNSLDRIYIVNDEGYTDDFFERLFHKEFSSILLRNHTEAFTESEWNKVNPPDFRYGQSGVDAIKTGGASTKLNPSYMVEGFLCEYATSTLENDFNQFAGHIFTPADPFWQLIETNPKIQRKLVIMVDFYRTLDPLFTEEYFRSLAE